MWAFCNDLGPGRPAGPRLGRRRAISGGQPCGQAHPVEGPRPPVRHDHQPSRWSQAADGVLKTPEIAEAVGGSGDHYLTTGPPPATDRRGSADNGDARDTAIGLLKVLSPSCRSINLRSKYETPR